MPSIKTITTELAVAMGILGFDNLDAASSDMILPKFAGTLTENTYLEFQTEFVNNLTNRQLYEKMHWVGLQLREYEPALSDPPTVQWLGPERQARTAAMARDLQAGYVAISVKAESNVIANPSPYNLFHALPAGEHPIPRSDNWYRMTAPDEYQSLFSIAREIVNGDVLVPELVEDYDLQTDGKTRKNFGRNLTGKLNDRHPLADIYIETYKTLSNKIASASAVRFNDNLVLSLDSTRASSVKEQLAQRFLRLGGTPYILAGMDKGQPFAVRIPDITSWQHTWQFSVIASPDTTSLQPEVYFDWQAIKKVNQEATTVGFHAEIRWSHGRFCGNPEGKFYKNFRWVNLPFFEVIFYGEE